MFYTLEPSENIRYNISMISVYFAKLMIHSVNLFIESPAKIFQGAELLFYSSYSFQYALIWFPQAIYEPKIT